MPGEYRHIPEARSQFQSLVNLRLTTEVASEASSELLEDYLLFQLQLRPLEGLATAAEFAPAKTQAASGSQGASAASSHSPTTLQPGSTIEVAQVEHYFSH